MSEIDRALNEISSIRRQVARSAEFRGYGPATLAWTAAMAAAAGIAQQLWMPHTTEHFLAVWLATAVCGAAVIGVQTYNRAQRMHSGMADEMLRTAVEQFLPAVGAGALLTLVLLRSAPQAAWMLPGLWQIIYGLGVFASCRFLPRLMWSAAAFYVATGMTCVALGDARALSPWAMAAPFATGQLLVAAMLYRAAKEAGDVD
jgi:hypothetical protein